VTWWFLPDGPASRRWYDYAARLEGRLVTAEGQLTRKDRLEALGLLAAGAAHEYRNTLSGIGALARWARAAPDTGAKDSALEGIVERTDGSLRSVAWFLEGLSTHGREQPRPMRLAADLEGLLGFVRATCRRDGTTVLFEAEGDPRVETRPSEIEHVLLNLLHNAARAVSRAGRGERRITVRATGSDGGAVIEVEDSGGGVPAEVVPRLFSPIATGAGGAGVGLYLARSLAERNGGGIEYEPVAGGSIFRLTLPERATGG
jgi:signal transduction histidine kinase